MAKATFNSVVAARTSVAGQVLTTSELLQQYESAGGLPSDLEILQQQGQVAEAASLGRSQARHAGKGMTLEVRAAFAAMKKEWSSIRSVLHAVRGNLARANAPAGLLAKIDGISTNEAELVSSVVEEEGVKKRRLRKSVSHEAQRAEIARDSAALLALTEIHPELAARRVDVERLQGLHKAATDLLGAFATRVTLQGAQKNATQVERAAVARQRAQWAASYPLLRALARNDERFRALLAETTR